MGSPAQPAERIKSVVLAVVLIGVVLFFALRSIPSAQRPTLHTPAATPSSTPHSTSAGSPTPRSSATHRAHKP